MYFPWYSDTVWVLCVWLCDQPRIEAIRDHMSERKVRLQELTEQKNGVEDEVFRKFCREIGVANIRSVHQIYHYGSVIT